ncbi:MAG: hypothetical protein MI717_08135 [Spirochaetales bacterium]|nr:hypothetical protein [Spirochaetales bacterium]
MILHNHHFLGWVSVVLFLFFISQEEMGASAPRLEPHPQIAFLANQPEPMSLSHRAYAAFLASGAQNPEKEYQRFMEIHSSLPRFQGSEAERGEALLEWMHENLLSRYVESQTRLDVLLSEGTYNCVSSAVLYLLLADDLVVEGVLTRDHAFCRVVLSENEGIDVETTTAFGFNPGTKREAIDAFSGRTGFTYVPPGNYRQRQRIGEKELISLILQNRIVALQDQGEWGATVGLALDRWTLAQSDLARMDFETSLVNYAAWADRANLREEGLSLLQRGGALLGESNRLVQASQALFGNQITQYLRSGKIEEAQFFLTQWQSFPSLPFAFVKEQQRGIEERRVDLAIREGVFEEALRVVDEAYSQEWISQSRWEEAAVYLWSREAKRLSNEEDWEKGWRFLLRAPVEYQRISQWERLENVYRGNVIVTLHNAFAEAFQSQNYAKAQQILDSARSDFPNESIFLKDEQLLEQIP